MIEISSDIIRSYVGYITGFWMIENGEEQAEDINEYYQMSIEMKRAMIYRGDLEPFRLGLDYYLCHPEINLEPIFQDYYGWENPELRNLFKYLRQVIYSESEPLNCEEVKNVKIVPMSKFDWWDSRIELQPKNYQEGWEGRTGKKLAKYNE